MTKKILALIMALCLVFALAACNNGGKDDETTTAAADTAVNGETVAADETEAADATEAVSGDTTDVSEEASTEAASEAETEAATQGGTQTDTPAASTKPSTTAEIVDYFNKAINSAKKDSKSITSNYMKHAQAGKIEGLSSTLTSLANSLMDTYMGEDKAKKNVTWSTAADKNAFFPVEKETWASKLTVADVQSATCTESNGVYTITIKTKADGRSENYAHGVGHVPKAFNVVLPGVVNDNIPGIAASMVGLSTMGYPMGKVVVKVDAETGNVKSADYDIQWTINFDKIGAAIPLGTKSSYVVTF